MSSFPQTGQDPQAPPSARSRRFAVAGFVLLLLLNAAAILSLGYFPTLDGPMLLYYAQAFGTLLAGHPAFHSYFQLQHVAGSHLFYFYFVAALSPFLKLTLIEKLFVALYIAWLAYSFYYLVEGIRPGRGLPLALFVLPFALNSTVYSAFYDFAFGAATALFICGWWLRNFDRLNPLRSALAAALLLIVIVMHLMDAAIVALFTSIHVALYGAMQFRLAGGGFARRMGVSFRKTLKPAAHVAAGAALLYAFRPASVGSAQTDPFFQDPLQRLRELAAFRPFSPFESRFYRGLLGIVLISAVAMTVAALWRQRRALSPR
ncbi:MAG: hypothetical protein LAQ30_25175, partial [Acidobacteriia bacterium]|nr:hypothetical protein [Terriglobia bacterium]